MNIIPAILYLALILPGSADLKTEYTKPDNKYYELRIYYCNPGKLDALIERFTNHTTKIFEKHGMENIGYWVPVDNKENALYYILAFPSKEARDASWKAFIADPQWQEVAKKSEENGKIISKITSIFLKATDFSPAIKGSIVKPDRIFELRTYYSPAGKLPNIQKRFADHSLKLLEKQGMTNIGYWTTIESDGSQPKLVYIVAHKDTASAAKSWDAFRKDPDWVKVKAESEKDGPIVEKVESLMMKPLPFSTIK